MTKARLLPIVALIGIAAGCDPCNHCGDQAPFLPGGVYRPYYVAHFPGDKPLLAAWMGRMLAAKCIGDFNQPNKNGDVYIFAKSHADADCIRNILQQGAPLGPDFITLDDAPPP